MVYTPNIPIIAIKYHEIGNMMIDHKTVGYIFRQRHLNMFGMDGSSIRTDFSLAATAGRIGKGAIGAG